MQLDSLADVVSFGAAPGLLVYKWALAPLGFVGLFLSFAFAACGALRLARFNVLAMRGPHGGGGRFFVGLPIPLAAGVLVSMVIAHHVGARRGARCGGRGPRGGGVDGARAADGVHGALPHLQGPAPVPHARRWS